jgi:hypothetical protein
VSYLSSSQSLTAPSTLSVTNPASRITQRRTIQTQMGIMGWIVAVAILCASALCEKPAEAAFAYVSSSAAFCAVVGGTPNAACTLGASVAVNGIIITCGSSFGENAASIPTDTNANTYHLIATATDVAVGGSAESNCWYAVNGTNNAPTVTQHWTGVTDNTFMYVAAYTGNKTTSPLIDSTGTNNLTSSTSQACGTPSATASGQLVFGYIQTTNSATSFAPLSSETERLEEPTYHQTQIEDKTSSGAGAIGPSWTLGATQTADCIVGIFDVPSVAATFSAGPTAVAASTTTYTVTFTATAAATVKCGAWLYGATVTAADVNAGTNAHGTFSQAATGSSQNVTLTVTDGTPAPLYDIYCTADGGSTKTNTIRTFLTPAAGFQFVTLTSLGTGSPADSYNSSGRVTISYAAQTVNYTVGALVVGGTSGAYGTIEIISDLGATGVLTIHTLSGSFQNGETLTDNRGGNGNASTGTSSIRAIAVGDIEVVPSTVSPAAVALTVDSSGQYSYTATGRQTALNGTIYDTSIPSYLTLDVDFVANNAAPTCSLNRTIPLVVGAAMTAYDVSAQCADGDNDTLTYAVISNNLPTGLALNATTGHVTGTPTANGDVTVQILALDGYGGTGIFQGRFVTSSGAVTPDCMTTPTTLSACENAFLSTFASTVAFAENPKCSGSVDANNVISTTPTKNTQIPFGSNISITYSTGSCEPPATRMVNCLRKTLAACQTLITAAFGTGVTLVSTSSCPAGYPSGKIWTQSPGPGRRTPVPANLRVNYCP